MPAAVGTENLDSLHAQRDIRLRDHRPLVAFVEGRPATAAVKFIRGASTTATAASPAASRCPHPARILNL